MRSYLQWIVLGGVAAMSCWGQSSIVVPISCGSLTSGGSTAPQVNLRAGQSVTYGVTFNNPSQYANLTPFGFRGSASSAGAAALSASSFQPENGRFSNWSLTYGSGGTATVTVSVAYSVLVGSEITVGCSGSLPIPVTVISRPSISTVNPNVFTVCGPDVSVTVVGTGFSPGARVFFGYAGLSTVELTAQPLNTSFTALSARLTRDALSRFPSQAGLAPAFIVTNPNDTDPSLPYTDVQVRPTPRLDSLTAASAASGAFRTLTATGTNFTQDTVLVLLDRNNGVRQVVIQNLTTRSFTTSLGEDTYRTLGPFTARVLNNESGNPVNLSNPTPSYYLDTCSPPLTLPGLQIGAPTSVTLAPARATACGPSFALTVTAADVITTFGAPRLQIGNTTTADAYTNARFSPSIPSAQLGTGLGSLTVGVANQIAANQFSANATATLAIAAPPLIGTPQPAQLLANGTAQAVTLPVQNLTPQTRIVLRRTNQPDLQLATTPAAGGTSVTVTIPAAATGAGSTGVQLLALNADDANPNGAVPSLGAGCPQLVALALGAPPSASLSQLVPNSEIVGRGSDLTVRVIGGNFRQGVRLIVNQEAPVTAQLTSANEVQLTLAAARFNALGNIQVRVQNLDDAAASAAQTFTVVAPRAPTVTLTATPAAPASPAEQPRLTLAQSAFSERALNAVFTLEFQPDASTGLTTWPANLAPLFPGNSRTVSVAIPTTGSTIALPNNGQFSLPFAAGVVTARLTALTVQGTTVSVLPSPAPSVAVPVRAVAPAVDTGAPPLFSRPAGATDYSIDFNLTSTPLNLTSITLRFSLAAGTTVEGATSFTFDNTNARELFTRISDFFRANLSTGGQCRLRVPLTITSGEATAIQSVTVQMANSVGPSTEVTINRQ